MQRHEIQLGMNDMSLGAKTEPLNMPHQLRREYHARHVASSNRDRERERVRQGKRESVHNLDLATLSI